MEPTNEPRLDKRILLVVIALGVLMFGSLAYQLFLSFHFHVVSTNPNTKQVGSISPFFRVNFNKTLSNDNLSVTSNPDAISSYKVSGKTLDIDLANPLTVDKTYTITIESISAKDGSRITNKSFTFKAQDIDFEDLPQDQQDAIQATKPPTADHNTAPTFNGLGDLANYGVTTDQLTDLQIAFTNYNSSAQNVTLTNIQPVPHNSESASTSDSINFNAAVDTQHLKAKIVYSSLTVARLYLYNQSGRQVFDSGDINTQASQ